MWAPRGGHLKFIENSYQLWRRCYWSVTVETEERVCRPCYIFVPRPRYESQSSGDSQQSPIKERISPDVKWALSARCLTFVLPSCQLARSMSLFFFPSSSIFPADLAEVHGERKKGTDDRERERTSKHLLGQKKKNHRNRLASNVSQSGWLARCQALLICFTKHLNGPDNCD